jgi:hypothetical protein
LHSDVHLFTSKTKLNPRHTIVNARFASDARNSHAGFAALLPVPVASF